MAHKRVRLIGVAIIIAIGVILILARCMPTEVAADPVMAGPPTIQEHLTAINSSINVVKWMAGSFIALLIYVWKSTMANMKTYISNVEGKADKAIDKVDEAETRLEDKIDAEKDRVNRDFRAVQTCNERHGNGH